MTFTGDALQILIQLIKDRTYSVKIQDCISCENISLYGVLQGSTLGPLLFTIYISPLKYIGQTPNVKYHMYADEIQIYAESCHYDKLMLWANNIRKWLLNNNLLINSSKTMLLNISLSNFIFLDIIFDNLLIKHSSQIKFLGIIV